MIGKVVLLVVVVLVVASCAWSIMGSEAEEAKYTVFEKHDAIELRDYAPMIVAQAEVTGEREKAINGGFRIIADYIFGNNTSAQKVSEKIAMTAPVIQQPSEKVAQKIAMTAPVIQSGEGNKWSVQFVMPEGYTMATLPKPNNAAVVLKEVPAKRFAVLRFSGIADADSLKKHSNELNAFIEQQKLKPLSAVTYGFFNPPWTLPFMRRNEVMVEIAR